MKRIIISVTNDLVTDQRVSKVCDTLQNDLDFEIVLIGRKLPNSLSLNRNYKTIRMKLFFNKKFLFYAEYNLRLFFKLLFLKKDVLLANDLDTLLPNYLISKLFSKKLVYDSHELFTEVSELKNRPFVRNIWLKIEAFIFPKLKNVYTVNNSIADFYKNKYKVNIKVIRNISPRLENRKIDYSLSKRIKGNKKMLILQGTGINIERGAEEAVRMMQQVKNIVLYMIGGGDVFNELKKLVKDLNLENKVFLLDKMPYDKLMEYTKIADLGLSLDKPTNLNYELSLPNKIFDYIQAGIPLLVSNRKEVSSIVNKNNIGKVMDTFDPIEMAKIIKITLADKEKISIWKKNLVKIYKEYTWESESKKLIKIFNNLK